MSEWSITLQPWRNIELEGGSLGGTRRASILSTFGWWVVGGPSLPTFLRGVEAD